MGQVDIQRDKLLSIAEAAEHIGKISGQRPSPTTVWRWCRKGIQGVQLEYVRLGRSIRSSSEALDRFSHALAAQDREVSSHQRGNQVQDGPRTGMRALWDLTHIFAGRLTLPAEKRPITLASATSTATYRYLVALWAVPGLTNSSTPSATRTFSSLQARRWSISRCCAAVRQARKNGAGPHAS